MKLITEFYDNFEVLTEAAENGKKNYFIRGVFLESEIKNRNGRIYPRSLLEKAVQNYTTKYINEKRALGELGHPASPTINHDRVSHIITELNQDGNNWIGKAKILNTPYGSIVKSLLDEGVKIGVSSRGCGSLKALSEGGNMVQDDYWIATAADIVHDPSAPNAFVNGVMENAEWVFAEGSGWVPQYIDQTKASIQKMSAKEVAQKSTALYENFLKALVAKRK